MQNFTTLRVRDSEKEKITLCLSSQPISNALWERIDPKFPQTCDCCKKVCGIHNPDYITVLGAARASLSAVATNKNSAWDGLVQHFLATLR